MIDVVAALVILFGIYALGLHPVGGSRADQVVIPSAPLNVPAPLPVPQDHSDDTTVEGKPPPVTAMRRVETTAHGEPIVRFDTGKEMALYVPRSIALHDGRFDLVVHFHGHQDRTRVALDRAELGSVMVSLNLGERSAVYENAAASASFLDRLVAFAERGVDESHRAPSARVGRIALSSWSAGFGAVRQIMKRPSDTERIDGLLLADGLFTDWSTTSAKSARKSAGHLRARPRDANLEKVADVVDFARRATKGERLFVLTHTSIDRRDYADAADVAEAMIRDFNIEKSFPDQPGRPTARSSTYASDMESFHVWGYGGTNWNDHLEQHDTLRKHFSMLKAYWHDS